MQSGISRFTRIGDWIFEVKMVRALRVEKYGDPYDAVATMTVNGESVYVDTHLTGPGHEFGREDWLAFYEFAKQLELKKIEYDKVRNGERQTRKIEIVENQQPRPKNYRPRAENQRTAAAVKVVAK